MKATLWDIVRIPIGVVSIFILGIAVGLVIQQAIQGIGGINIVTDLIAIAISAIIAIGAVIIWLVGAARHHHDLTRV